MMRTANLKIKMTRKMSKLLLLQKLRKRGIGVNEVEEYARKEIGRGKGGGGQSAFVSLPLQKNL